MSCICSTSIGLSFGLTKTSPINPTHSALSFGLTKTSGSSIVPKNLGFGLAKIDCCVCDWNSITNRPSWLTGSSITLPLSINNIFGIGVGYAYWNGSIWTFSTPISGVTSVNGRTGAVVLSVANTGSTLQWVTISATETQLQIPTATTSITGLLSSTDWNTFNNKFNTPSGTTSQYIRGDGSLATLNTAILSTTLGGLSIAGSSITSSDTILQAFGSLQNQINGVLGGVTFISIYDAAANVLTLTNGVGTKGYYYIVSVDGTINFGAGNISFKVGDWIIYNGTIWDKVDNTDAVSDVNGSIGSISLVGTANRITVTGNQWDIASTYVGQSSITTLGTITTGVWNGTAIANANLANSTILIGGQTLTLGAAATLTFTGLTSVTSTTFVGALTGNASGTAANVTGIVLGANGGTGIANTGFTITLAGNLQTTGAFNTIFAVSGSNTYTLPDISTTLVGKPTATAMAANQIAYWNSATEITSGANLTYDSTIAITQTSGTGSIATLTFAAQLLPPYAVNQTIVVAGAGGYNGTHTVISCTLTAVTYANATTGNQAAGTISGTPLVFQNITIVDADGISYTEFHRWNRPVVALSGTLAAVVQSQVSIVSVQRANGAVDGMGMYSNATYFSLGKIASGILYPGIIITNGTATQPQVSIGYGSTLTGGSFESATQTTLAVSGGIAILGVTVAGGGILTGGTTNANVYATNLATGTSTGVGSLVLAARNADTRAIILVTNATERWRISGTAATAGNLSNNGLDGTAYITLKSGTASIAPFKFTIPAALLTTPEALTLEPSVTGDVLHFTTTTGTVRVRLGTNSYKAITSTYSITEADDTIDCTSGTFTVTLRTAIGISGKPFNIINSGSGVITLATTSSQTIGNGSSGPIPAATTVTINPGEVYNVQSDNANYKLYA